MIKLFFYSLLLLLTYSSGLGQNNFTKYYNEAVENIERENYNSGIEKLGKALGYKDEAENKYKLADAYIYRGFCRSQLKNYKAAINDIDEAIKLKPEYAKAYKFKAGVYLADKKYDDCVRWCDKGLAIKSGSEELLITKSQALYALKKFEDSKLVLSGLLEVNPKNTYAIRSIASVFYRQKMYDSSIIYYSRVLAIDPLDFVAYYDRGIGRSHTTDSVGARTDMEKAMLLDSVSKYAGFNNLGYYLKLEKKDFAGAIIYFNKAINLNPEFSNAYCNRGFAELNLGNLSSAYRDIKKAIELDKTNSFALKNLGLVYLKDNKKKNACEFFKKALELGYTEMYDDEVEKLIETNCQ